MSSFVIEMDFDYQTNHELKSKIDSIYKKIVFFLINQKKENGSRVLLYNGQTYINYLKTLEDEFANCNYLLESVSGRYSKFFEYIEEISQLKQWAHENWLRSGGSIKQNTRDFIVSDSETDSDGDYEPSETDSIFSEF